MKNEVVKSLYIIEGIDAFGGHVSVHAKEGHIDIDLHPQGVYVHHHVRDIKVLVPYSNIKYIKFESDKEKSKKQPTKNK